ncbi:MAG TPA: dienelactone hydrolase family protein [Anaerolineaceae bacterium]|nr:dienelactone hydrolase family protein [Anaerolineaceae bacterium]
MNYFQKYLAEEFAEDYQEGRLNRRQAIKLISSVTGSVVMATSILAACGPREAPTQIAFPGGTATPTATFQPPTPPDTLTEEPPVDESPTGTARPSPQAQVQGTVSVDDPALEAKAISLEGVGATLMGYQAVPKGSGPFPVVLVCHENRGLTPYIQDVTRRLAKAGYAALAVDLLSRQGGTSALSADQIPGALGNTNPDQFVQDFLSGWQYLQKQSFAQARKVGMVGFCFGGGVTWLVATRMPELRAAVPYYGPLPPVADVPKIQAAVLAFYGGKDTRINGGIPPVEEAMQKNGKIFEKVIYPDADHAFHNDTGPRYNPEAAQDAWKRTLDWFRRYLD